MTSVPVTARRALLVIGLLAAWWGACVWLSGGIALDAGPLRVSSRNPRNPLLLALVALMAWSAAAPPRQRRAAAAADDRWLASGGEPVRRLWRPSVAPWIAALAAAAVVAVALTRGAHVAGGSDSYGYVSQAHMLASGTLRVPEPLLQDPPGGIPREALVPLGYRLSPDGTAFVPVYSPGLPLAMAALERAAGREAVFYVVPIAAAVAVWCTYVLGAALATPGVGLAAALLLAISPTFLTMVSSAPLSDLPVTAWWTLMWALLLRRSPASALAAGLAAGAAVLTRPNLVLLGIAPAALLAYHVVTSAGQDRALAARRFLAFGAASLPGCLAVAWFNWSWYGSPLTSGYGPLDYLYGLTDVWANVTHYPRWLVGTQTPLIVLALGGPIVLWRDAGARGRRPLILALTGFVAAVSLSYVFFAFFDEWTYLRFLLPAFPMMFIFMASALRAVLLWLPGGVRTIAALAVAQVLIVSAVTYTVRNNVLNSAVQTRYADAGRWAAGHLPARAVLLAKEHSGSGRYYSGRPTLRYDLLPPERLDAAIGDLRRRGYRVFALVDDWEVPVVNRTFEGRTRLVPLRTPLVTLPWGVAVYELSGGPLL